jgi:hypothetical protein
MFGQWALGTSPIGEPEELSSVVPTPADCIVWITTSENSDVMVEVTTVTENN